RRRAVREMRGQRILGERDPHQVDDPPLLRSALDPAAPILRPAQRVDAIGFDPLAQVSRERAVALGDARLDLKLGMRFQHRAGVAFRLLLARAPQFVSLVVSLAHGWLQTCVGVPAQLGGSRISRVLSRHACLSPGASSELASNELTNSGLAKVVRERTTQKRAPLDARFVAD